jgi:topoisomerase-4 subunit A
VVGDVIGKYHPHGDSAVYETMVRMSQDFTLRYPLIDGQGNWGTRDGDAFAAQRYTECKLTSISSLLLDDIDDKSIDWIENYDGSMVEPRVLPAKLPFSLLNGQFGIAVGMATEIPSHNLNEIAEALITIYSKKEKNLLITIDDVLESIKGPDFATYGKIINSPAEIKQFYQNGSGTFKQLGTYTVEKMDKGNYRIIINSLPLGTSTANFLIELDNLANPKIKNNKKKLEDQQILLKTVFNNIFDKVRDDSDSKNPIRIIIEPKNKSIKEEDIIGFLIQNTSFNYNYSMNLTLIGLDGKPKQKNLLDILLEFTEFRKDFLIKKFNARIDKIDIRMNILTGRLRAIDIIDQIIAIIKNDDNAKASLLELSFNAEQVEDILEMKLRYLAGLESIKLEKEQKELLTEKESILSILSKNNIYNEMIKQTKKIMTVFSDDRRTIIEEQKIVNQTISIEEKVKQKQVSDVIVYLSKNGYLRQRSIDFDASKLEFKLGDEPYLTLSAKSNDTLALIDDKGTLFNISVDQLQDKGEGRPLSFYVENIGQTKRMVVVAKDTAYCVVSKNGYGFICNEKDLFVKNKAGKKFLTLENIEVDGKKLIDNVAFFDKITDETSILVQTDKKRQIIYSLTEIKVLPKGKGVLIFNGDDDETIEKIAILTEENTSQFNPKYIGKRNNKVKAI